MKTIRKIQSLIALFIFKLMPDEKQLKYNSLLNTWQVPFILFLPLLGYSMLTMEGKSKITDPITNYTKKKFGVKEILRYHNVRNPNKGDMTNEKFELWFKENFSL